MSQQPIEGGELDDGPWDEQSLERVYTYRRANYLPWGKRDEALAQRAEAWKKVLTRKAGARKFGTNSFVSIEAHVYTNTFEIGDNSWVAAGAILRGDIVLGANTTVNPFAHIAGTVSIGNGVRIAGLVSIYGFNHGYSRTDVAIYRQAHTRKGIVIGDDVWIGANAVIIDGVTIGSHSIVAGGAVVTKSFPEFSVIGGNPARLIRSRLADTPIGASSEP